MSTKKSDTIAKKELLERGRFARLLGAGFVVEVSPSAKRVSSDDRSDKSGQPKAS